MTQFDVQDVTSSIRRVTFANPPVNVVGADTLVKSVLERGLQAEPSEHLGYAAHDPAGKGSGNSHNGSTAKTVQSEIRPIDVRVPRDRAGTFTPNSIVSGDMSAEVRRATLRAGRGTRRCSVA